jgi:hypothetical protein
MKTAASAFNDKPFHLFEQAKWKRKKNKKGLKYS